MVSPQALSPWVHLGPRGGKGGKESLLFLCWPEGLRRKKEEERSPTWPAASHL